MTQMTPNELCQGLREGQTWTLRGTHPRFQNGEVNVVFTITEVPCPVADRVPEHITMRLMFEDAEEGFVVEQPTHMSLRRMRIRWDELVNMGFVRHYQARHG